MNPLFEYIMGRIGDIIEVFDLTPVGNIGYNEMLEGFTFQIGDKDYFIDKTQLDQSTHDEPIYLILIK